MSVGSCFLFCCITATKNPPKAYARHGRNSEPRDPIETDGSNPAWPLRSYMFLSDVCELFCRKDFPTHSHRCDAPSGALARATWGRLNGLMVFKRHTEASASAPINAVLQNPSLLILGAPRMYKVAPPAFWPRALPPAPPWSFCSNRSEQDSLQAWSDCRGGAVHLTVVSEPSRGHTASRAKTGQGEQPHRHHCSRDGDAEHPSIRSIGLHPWPSRPVNLHQSYTQ